MIYYFYSNTTEKIQKKGGKDMRNNLEDRIRGALYGVAIGDALGAPLEFMDANSINAKHPGGVWDMIGGGWLNVKPGEVTDDTQMTIAVARGILRNPENPVPEVGKLFIEWYESGPKDIGATCANAIGKVMNLGYELLPQPLPRELWMAASELTDRAMNGRTAGNGALMRTIYPALYYNPGRLMMQATMDIARMTHMSEESTKCCIQYVQEVWLLINGYTGPVGLYSDRKHEPTGYVIDSYVVASEAIGKSSTFESALAFAINQGGDADTIGAITGGLAGAKYGYSNIPPRWIAKLDPEIRKELDYLAEEAMKNKGEEK